MRRTTTVNKRSPAPGPRPCRVRLKYKRAGFLQRAVTGGPPRFEVGETMIHTPPACPVVSSSPRLQRKWGIQAGWAGASPALASLTLPMERVTPGRTSTSRTPPGRAPFVKTRDRSVCIARLAVPPLRVRPKTGGHPGSFRTPTLREGLLGRTLSRPLDDADKRIGRFRRGLPPARAATWVGLSPLVRVLP